MPAPPEDMRLHVRSRPGTYIGGLNPYGLRQIIDDVVTGQLDRPGVRPDRVRCTIGADGTYEVVISGEAVVAVRPEDFDPATLDPWPEDGFPFLAVACALSNPFEAEIVRDGQRRVATFAAGLPSGPVVTAAAAAGAPPSVRARYRPDPELFGPGTTAGFLALCGRAREWAAFHPHTRITLEDEATRQRRDHHYPHGLLSLAEELEHGHHGAGWTRPAWRCRVSRTDGGPAADIVLVQRPGSTATVWSYVNGQRTADGGSHVDGLRAGVAEITASYATEDPDHPFARSRRPDPLSGLSAIVAVWLDDPAYAAATKDGLADDRAPDLVRRMVAEQLPGEVERTRVVGC